MRPIDGVTWLSARAAADADFASAWAAFKEYVQLSCDEPEERYGQRVRALGGDDDGDLLLFEAGPGGFDLIRQFSFYDDEGEYVCMATVCLSARHPATDEQLWAEAGPPPETLPQRPPAVFANWVGGAREWCAAIEGIPEFGRALAVSPEWSFHDG
jgi:hypothetical protein